MTARAMAPPNPRPCAECPWRLANQGRRMQHGFYTKANLARLWGGLRRGARMTCHPTDPFMADFEGYEELATREITHECAGAAIIVQRELDRFQDCARAAEAEGKRDAYRRYRAGRRGTMTLDGLRAAVATFLYGGAPPPFGSGLPTRRMELNDPEIGYPPLGAWEPR